MHVEPIGRCSLTVLKSEPERWIGIVERPGSNPGPGPTGDPAIERRVVKLWLHSSAARALQRAVRSTPADRQVKGWVLLRDADVPVAAVLGHALARVPGDRGLRTVEALVCEHVPGPTLLRTFAEAGSTDMPSLAIRVGLLGAQLASHGLAHIDLKPSNIVLRSDSAGEPRPIIVDTQGVERLPGTLRSLVLMGPLGRGRTHRLARMHASLLIEPIGCRCVPSRTLRHRYALAYTSAVLAHVLDPESPPARALARTSARRMWRTIDRVIRLHGDPTPRVDPLRG